MIENDSSITNVSCSTGMQTFAMATPRFVIVTPVLNGAQYINNMLDSIRVQTDGDWVHYILDGGSIDGTLELLSMAEAADPRRHVLVGKDRGIYDAILKGFEQAAFDGVLSPRSICLWLGADDLLMPWAFSTLREVFDVSGAEWVTAYPAIFDHAGRLITVAPYNWYPQLLIKWGFFNNRILGSIQQESTFFTYSLLSRLSQVGLDRIRNSELAGDFLLFRCFARYSQLMSIPSVVSGFRFHGSNLSSANREKYITEVRESGIWLPPHWIGSLLRLLYRPTAALMTSLNFRRVSRQFQQKILQ